MNGPINIVVYKAVQDQSVTITSLEMKVFGRQLL